MKLIARIATFALCLVATAAGALEIQSYTPKAFASAQAANKPVALHFHADWCPACRAQAEALGMLEADRKLDVTVLVVDYDREKELRRALGVRSQSTIVVFRGKAERARLAGETSVARIEAALRAAL